MAVELFDLDTITCTHFRVHDALRRLRKILTMVVIPVFIALFVIMAWTASPAAAIPLGPWVLLAAVASIGALVVYAFMAVQELWADVRALSAFHNQVLQASDDDDEKGNP